MIAVKLEGRLGNQLFQYAFIYAAAKTINTRFYLDKSVDYSILPQYFNIERDFCAFADDRIFSVKGYKNLFSHYARWMYYYLIQRLWLLKPVTFSNNRPPVEELANLSNGYIYSGYFQSAKYFAEQTDAIRKQFTVKEKYHAAFQSVFNSLPKAAKYVVVHVRRGDYINHGLALKPSYYHEIIKSIHTEDNFYIFVSDDPEFVKCEFAYLGQKYVSENDEITDFQFLTAADICVLSNSSFSWWGAWLNNRNAKIIAPKYWLGAAGQSEIPVDVIPEGWIKY